MPFEKTRLPITGLTAWEPPNRDGYTTADNAQILTLELRISLLMIFIPFIFSSAVQNLNDQYHCSESGTYIVHGL